MDKYIFTVTERFLRYVQIDTQSDPFSESFPSTAKQKDLGRLLVSELQAMGLDDAVMDDFGYVMATVPSNTEKTVPVICLCAHMDTSPDCSGAGVKPVTHHGYEGGEIVLPDAPDQFLSPENHPALADQVGNDIITASGHTLLGADNKAGIAEIMDAAHYFMTHPECRHGAVRLLFTPDEEIGRGVEKLDMNRLGAEVGYTIDGETVGSLEDENFCADKARINIHGVSTHPGMAKGKLVNALKAASALLGMLPADRLSPETTEGRQGFIHPLYVQGSAEKATIELLLRDFSIEGLQAQAGLLKNALNEVLKRYAGAQGEIEVTPQYRNMKEILERHPQVTTNAEEAIRRAGLQPKRHAIRGGTDGAMLCFKGLPCPNIFAGEHAFHSRQEWVSIQDMEKAVEVIVNLCKIWEEKA